VQAKDCAQGGVFRFQPDQNTVFTAIELSTGAAVSGGA
jgi:hypothetical protein